MTLCFTLLALAICCVWLPRIGVERPRLPAWAFLFALAIVAGLASGVLSWIALVTMGALATCCWLARQAKRPAVQHLYCFSSAAIAFALAIHIAPGFHNPALFTNLQLSTDAAPFTQYLNFDKGAAGLLLLVTYGRRVTNRPDFHKVVDAAVVTTIGTAVCIVAMGVTARYFYVEPKWSTHSLTFLGSNLFFTCVAEEAFFRGLLQERLAASLRHAPAWQLLPVLVSGVLFGIAHALGGATLLLLASVAGLSYAAAYHLTRRVETPIAVHFLINAIQFLFFTYPYAIR